VVQSRLETPATPPTGAEAARDIHGDSDRRPDGRAAADQILPLLLKTLWASIKGWLSRLFR